MESSSHSRNKSYLAGVYKTFNVLLNSLCVLLRIFVLIFIRVIDLWFLVDFGVSIMLASKNEFGRDASSSFLEEFDGIEVNSSLHV